MCHNLRVMIVQLLLSVSFFLNLREMENWHDSHFDLVNSVYKTEKRVGNNVLITMSSMQVQVYVTVSHDEKFSRVHSPSAVWVQSVTTRGFEVCARESGIGSNGTGIINWLAFQGHPQMTRGSVTFSGMWTTEAKCDKINLSQV